MYLDLAQLLPASAMARVEECLRREVESDLPFMEEVASHLINAGGKRIRPGLVIACASIGAEAASEAANGISAPASSQSDSSLTSRNSFSQTSLSESSLSESSVLAGVAVELVHIGSLHHDDVMDGAATRRNAASVNAKWDTLTAVLSGDFLLARASVLAARIGSEASELLATTIGELCEGQIREHQDAHRCDRTIQSYEMSIRGKTASLLSTSCRLGGLTGGLTEEETEAVTEFGRSYGMAFQIFDDINDLTSDHSVLGKPSGQDVMEGNYTLPVLLTLKTPAGEELEDLLTGGLKEQNLQRVLEIVRSGTGTQEAMNIARSWAHKAIDSLAPLRDTPAASNLRKAAQTLMASLPVAK